MSSMRSATCRSVGALGDELRGGVNDGTEVPQDIGVPGADRGLKQPAQSAAG